MLPLVVVVVVSPTALVAAVMLPLVARAAYSRGGVAYGGRGTYGGHAAYGYAGRGYGYGYRGYGYGYPRYGYYSYGHDHCCGYYGGAFAAGLLGGIATGLFIDQFFLPPPVIAEPAYPPPPPYPYDPGYPGGYGGYAPPPPYEGDYGRYPPSPEPQYDDRFQREPERQN